MNKDSAPAVRRRRFLQTAAGGFTSLLGAQLLAGGALASLAGCATSAGSGSASQQQPGARKGHGQARPAEQAPPSQAPVVRAGAHSGSGPELLHNRPPAPPRGELEARMRQVPIAFYMAPWCPYCRKAKLWLRDGGYRFEEHDIDNDERASAHLLMVNPRGSIPMFEIGGRRVIGFAPDMVRALLRVAVLNGA